MSIEITQDTPQVEVQTAEEIRFNQRVERIHKLTEWLDSSIKVPGTGFTVGWDTIIGLLPGAGDLITTLFSVWIINEARSLGVTKITLARMVLNTGIDTLVGAVPLAGDVFDAAFKSNVKNVKLLQASLRKRGLTFEIV